MIKQLIAMPFLNLKKIEFSESTIRLEFKLENDVIQLTEIAIIEELSNHYK